MTPKSIGSRVARQRIDSRVARQRIGSHVTRQRTGSRVTRQSIGSRVTQQSIGSRNADKSFPHRLPAKSFPNGFLREAPRKGNWRPQVCRSIAPRRSPRPCSTRTVQESVRFGRGSNLYSSWGLACHFVHHLQDRALHLAGHLVHHRPHRRAATQTAEQVERRTVVAY